MIEESFPTSTETLPVTPTVAEIDLEALQHNARLLMAQAGRASVMAVVKADAYGHGAVPVAHALTETGIHDFGVATVSEGIQLREAGINGRILVFGAPLPEYFPTYPAYDLEMTIPSRSTAEAAVAAFRTPGPLRVHVKVDTGMGRIGVSPEETPEVISILERTPGITVAGLWTHFANADEENDIFTLEQLSRFRAILDRLGNPPFVVHTANSAAMFTFPETFESFENVLVRPGIALYGGMDLPGNVPPPDIRPVMRVTSRVSHVKTVEKGTTVSYGRTWKADRPVRIATVLAGYADGYFRLLSNRAEVGIRNRRYPVVGAICMDMFMVNLGDPDGPGAEIGIGEEVTLFGPGGPSACEVASWAETISYEVFCSVSKRVPRLYSGIKKVVK